MANPIHCTPVIAFLFLLPLVVIVLLVLRKSNPKQLSQKNNYGGFSTNWHYIVDIRVCKDNNKSFPKTQCSNCLAQELKPWKKRCVWEVVFTLLSLNYKVCQNNKCTNRKTHSAARLSINTSWAAVVLTGKLILSAALVVITVSLQRGHTAGYLTSTHKSRKSTFMRSLICKIYLQNILQGFKPDMQVQKQEAEIIFYMYAQSGIHTRTYALHNSCFSKNWHVKANYVTYSLRMNGTLRKILFFQGCATPILAEGFPLFCV